MILPEALMLCVCVSFGSGGRFIEIPRSQNVSVGETAEFKCQHSTADGIRWKVNGSVLRPSDLPTGIDVTSENRLHILTIMGMPEYNGTEVVGEAISYISLQSLGETEPAAILEVFTYTFSPDSPVFINTPSPDSPGGFVEVPRSLNVTVRAEATFRCNYSSVVAIIAWLINGTLINGRTELEGAFHDNFRGDILTVTALPEYNTTMIQCQVYFPTGSITSTAAAILNIQGALAHVSWHRIESSAIKWEPPFSLDLTNVEIDIIYCVDVYNITCGVRDHVVSDCDVTSTTYTITPDGYLYEYIITPRSNVEGAINGTPSQPLIGGLPEFWESSNRLSLGTFGKNSGLRAYQTELAYNAYEPLQLPSFYTLSLKSFDGLDDKPHVRTTVSNTMSGLLILDVIGGLTFRRLWNCTVLAYGCEDNGILNGELSTHDFRNIQISSPLAGNVRVTGSFTDDSTASGVLVIIANQYDVHYHKANRNGIHMSTIISGIPGGNYTVSVFVMEENGMPFERVATLPRPLVVKTGDTVQPSSAIKYSLNFTSSGICVECFFMEKDNSECIAVVHDRLGSGGVMKISSHRFKRNGDIAYGCIDQFDRDKQQLGVIQFISLPEIMNRSNNTSSSLVAIPVTLVLLLLIVVLVLTIVVVYKKKQINRKILSRSVVTVTAIRDNDTEHGCKNEYECLPNEEVALETSSLVAYENTRSVESPARSPFLQPQTPVGAVTPVSPHDHRADRNEQKGPVYTYVFTSQPLSEEVKAPPVVDRKEEYAEIIGFKSPLGLHYSNVTCPMSSSQPKEVVDDWHKTEGYSEVKHQQVESKDCSVDDKEVNDNISCQPDVITPTPITLLNLVSVLQDVAPKWKELAEAMSVDEDDVDEIYTKNEMDEYCLHELIERFIVVHHNWEDVVAALRKIDEEALAAETHKCHVLPSHKDSAVQPEDVNQIDVDKVAVYMGSDSTMVCRPVNTRSSVDNKTYCIPDPGVSTVGSNASMPQRETQPPIAEPRSADSAYYSSAASQDTTESSESNQAVVRTRSPTFRTTTPQDDGNICQGFLLLLETEVPHQIVQGITEEELTCKSQCHPEVRKRKTVASSKVVHCHTVKESDVHAQYHDKVTSGETDTLSLGTPVKDSILQKVINWCFLLHDCLQSFLTELNKSGFDF